MFVKTGRLVAVKQLLSEQVNEQNMERFYGEILLHSKLHHPHLVAMLGASWEPPNFCLVLEYCSGGDLESLLKRESKPEDLTWFRNKISFAKEIAQGLAYLHAQSVLHRDIKPPNVLVDDGMRMKLSDFGESRNFLPDENNMTTVGTNFYIAPEVFRGDTNYNEKCDVFGYGILLIAMCCKEGDLRNFFVKELGRKVRINANYVSIEQAKGWVPKLEGGVDFDLSDDEEFATGFTKLIKTMIDLDPEKRPAMSLVVQALHNLERWIYITPPKWLKKVSERSEASEPCGRREYEPLLTPSHLLRSAQCDDKLIVGSTIKHQTRGLGCILNFDGEQRVHVLFYTSPFAEKGLVVDKGANRLILTVKLSPKKS